MLTELNVGAQDAGLDPRLLDAHANFEAATKLKAAGKYGEALPLAERALSQREAALGSTHVEVASCLHLTGDLYQLRGDYARAESLLERGRSIRAAVLGESHPDVAQSLNTLAVLHEKQGQHNRAEQLYERALAIREAALGKTHPDVAASLHSLGKLYWALGQYDRVEPLWARALAIREEVLGKAHPAMAGSLQNLAILYARQDRHDLAEPFYKRALAINEAVFGPESTQVARVLNDLGVLYKQQGQYERAEPLYKRALAIREATLGAEHPDAAESLTSLGNLYFTQGEYDRARSLQERALTIRETVLGKTHPEVAQSLNNLATVHLGQGRYNQAEPLYRRAIDIYETTLGKDHPYVTQPLDNLAVLYRRLGQYGRARLLHERALAICEATLGKGHSSVSASLNNLAGLYFAQGQYDQAALFGERSLAVREAALGASHPQIAESLYDLARLRLGQRRLADVTPLFTRALAISDSRLRREALDFSESRLSSFLRFLGEDEQRLYSLARIHPNNPEVRRLALVAALLFKGRSIEEASNTSRIILRSLDPRDRDIFIRLRELRTQLAKLSLDGPGKLAPAEYQQRLKTLADEGDSFEADLAKRSAPLRALTTLPPPAEIVVRVASALPGDSALIEVVAYADHPLVPKPGTPESKLAAQPRYLAMVLFSDGRTGVVDLGPAAPIDEAASRLRDALASRDARFQGAAQKFYQLAFKPLLPVLGNTRRLFLAPDGQFALVPFAALHDGHRFLADTFDFTYLTSGRDILPRPGHTPSSPSVIILADPDYSGSSTAARTSATDGGVTLATTERSFSVERFFAEHRAGLSERRWVPLLGTRQEAEAIQRLLPQAQLYLGIDATKERLLNLSSPQILHVATHGFFLEDATAPSGTRGLADMGPASGDPIPHLEDPLLRSGLVLAGGNASVDLSNSLVTALELAGLNLWGTELVVLSACDTGRGELKRGQGVYGLRRSLVVAGAETLVVSLWKVDDETTRTMMESYYRNLLTGQGRAVALQEAMLSLRAQHPHPYYWAPFIALGRDVPLRRFANPAQEP